MTSSIGLTANAANESQPKHSTNFFHYSQPIVLQVGSLPLDATSPRSGDQVVLTTCNPQVEDEHYQLPRFLFPHSEMLREVYPALKSGSMETVIIQLYDCRKIQVEAFLTVLLQPFGHLFPPDHPCSKPETVETLLKALLFADQWGFRTMALDLKDRMNNLMTGPFERITYGRLHRVMSWFRFGLEELVGSEEDINVEDANSIGFVLVLKIYHARSRVRSLLADATSSTSDQKSTVVTGVVEEMFTDKLDPWTFPNCYIDDTESDFAEERVSLVGRSSSYNEPTEEVSQSGGDDLSDTSLADLGYQNEDNVGSSENIESVVDDGFEVIETEEKRTIRELVTAILHGDTTTSLRLLSIVPKVCADTKKKKKTCGDHMRCRKCCIRKLKVYQPLPGTLRAKTPLGQVLLDQLGEIANGKPICLEIVLKNVEKSCKKVEKTCGPSRRCSKCCKKAAKMLLGKGEIV